MTTREMQIEFERLVQIANPEYLINQKLDTDTIFYFLNAAQHRFIRLNYMNLDNVVNATFNLRKTTEAIKSLFTTTVLSANAGNNIESGGKGLSWQVPNNYFLYVDSTSKVSQTYKNLPDKDESGNAKSYYAPNILITKEELEMVLPSYFNSPIIRKPYCVLDTYKQTPGISVYVDAYTELHEVKLVYVRLPQNMGTTGYCELAESVHQELVELAVEIFTTEAAYRISGGEKPWRRTPERPTNAD